MHPCFFAADGPFGAYYDGWEQAAGNAIHFAKNVRYFCAGFGVFPRDFPLTLPSGIFIIKKAEKMGKESKDEEKHK